MATTPCPLMLSLFLNYYYYIHRSTRTHVHQTCQTDARARSKPMQGTQGKKASEAIIAETQMRNKNTNRKKNTAINQHTVFTNNFKG